jgi:YggT family protein
VTIICQLLSVYVIVLIARAILSWFPISQGSALAPIVHLLYTVTEPLLAPLRRVIPALGGFDLSFIVLFIIIQVVQNQICSGHRFL